MAAPGNQFFIQSNIKKTAPHHESFKQLWETKWKKPVCTTRTTHNPVTRVFVVY